MIKVDKGVSGGKKVVKKHSVTKRLAVTIVLMLIVFVVAFVITYLRKAATAPPPSSYQECIAQRSSIVQESYPAVCVTKSGARFIQPISEEELKLLESPLKPKAKEPDGAFCGGIAAIPCSLGYVCQLEGNFPDAGGKCIRE
jgi:hypothetical protein